MKVIKRHALQRRLTDFKKKDSIFFMVQPLISSRIGFLLAFVNPIEFNILTSNHTVRLSRDGLSYLHMATLGHLILKSSSSFPSTMCLSSKEWIALNTPVYKAPDCIFHTKHVCLFPPIQGPAR